MAIPMNSTTMNMNMNAGGRNVMPQTDLLSDESNLPAQFVAAKRISMKTFMNKPSAFHKTVQDYCIKKGKPLVISDMDALPAWNNDIFSLDQLKLYRGDKNIVYDFPQVGKKQVNLGQFIERLQQEHHMQRDKSYAMLRGSTQKVYAKDITCPRQYDTALKKIVPDYLLPHGPDDLFSILPPRFQAENFMCYLGQDNTGTPIHRDLCGTMGHNLMTMGDDNSYAEWIIIENQYRDKLAGILRPSQTDDVVADLSSPPKHTKSSFMESDRAWLHNAMLENAQFQAQVIVQRPGDLVIVPSRAYHQVRNVGVSVKVAWNRITAQTLQYAFEDQLPLYQTINRPEVYKCKAIVALTIEHWNKELKKLKNKKVKSTPFSEMHGLHSNPNRRTFFNNATTLLALFLSELIEPEMLYQEHKIITDRKNEVFTVRCDFCYSDIFHRYYHCKTCDKYDLCLNCYSMGRSCEHPTEMKMHQSPKTLNSYIDLYKEFVQNLNQVIGSKIGYICEEQKEDFITDIDSSEASNLAITCVRLESFRQKNKTQYNTLTCQHCSTSTTTVNELNNQGISLATVFQQSPCSNAAATTERQDVDVYSCQRCIENCDKCEELQPTAAEFDIVYYTQPDYNLHSRGGTFDFGVAKVEQAPSPMTTTATTPTSSNKKKRGRDPEDEEGPSRKR